MTRQWIIVKNKRTGKEIHRFIAPENETKTKKWASGYNRGYGGQKDVVELKQVGGKQHMHHKKPQSRSMFGGLMGSMGGKLSMPRMAQRSSGKHSLPSLNYFGNKKFKF